MLCACDPGSVAWNVLVVMNANVYFNGLTLATIDNARRSECILRDFD